MLNQASRWRGIAVGRLLVVGFFLPFLRAADANSVLLLHGEGSNGSVVVTDSSPSNRTMTARGSVQISTALAKSGSGALRFTGTAPDALTFSSALLLNGPFTFECWFYSNNIELENEQHFYNSTWTSGGYNSQFRIQNSSEFFFHISGVGLNAAVPTMSSNTWHHVALVRDQNNVIKVYLDGVASIDTVTTANPVRIDNIGSWFIDGPSAHTPFNGYLDDVHISNVARYTSNFTPSSDATAPTVALTAPSAGATVSGASVTVSANASDNVGVAGVQFKLDGANIGSEDTSAPYSMAWNSTGASNGNHTFTAVARDAAGNTTTSSSVQVTVANGPGDISSGLVSWWKFDETSGTFAQDTGTGGNHGTLQGAAGWAAGKFGNALSLATGGAPQYVSLPNNGGSLNTPSGGSITVTAWVKTRFTSDTSGAIVSFRDPSGNPVVDVMMGSNGPETIAGRFNPLVRSDGGTGLTYFSSTAVNSLPAINDQAWHLVAFVVDRTNSQLRAYVDGSSIAMAYSHTGSLTFSNYMAVGYEAIWGDNGYSRWNGYIDDVRVYQRALTATDIAALFTAVPDTTAPTVALTAPSAGSTVSGTSVTVSANASDNVGVAGVQFKIDGTNIGAEDTSAPYSAAWNSALVADGTHTLTAVARDAYGNITTSSSVLVIVSNNGGSSDITSNLVGHWKFDEASGATAIDSSSSANNGTLQNNPSRIGGKVGSGALSFNAASSQSVKMGTTNLPIGSSTRTTSLWFKLNGNHAQMLFTYGNQSSDQRWGMYYNADGFLTFENFTGSRKIPWTYDTNWHHWVVTYPSGQTSLAHALLYLDGVNVATTGTSPTLNTQVGGDGATIGAISVPWGTGSMHHVTGDIDDVRVYSRALSPTDIAALYAYTGTGGDTTAPTVALTSPSAGATVSGASVTVSANASDNVGIVGVQFKVDGNNIGTEDASAPYSVSWNTTTLADGNHTLTAVARDAAGNTTTSSSVQVNVSNADTAAPTVALTAPSAGATVSGASVTVSANASDNVGVAGVLFKIDGNDIGTEDTSAPYSVTWNTTALGNGNHTLTAVARDAAGNTTTSSSVQVTVANSTGDISSGLVSWWKFDETSGTSALDSGTGGNHGTLQGAAGWAAGKFGNALSLATGAAPQYVLLSNNGGSLNIQSGGSVTVTAWIKTRSTSDFAGAILSLRNQNEEPVLDVMMGSNGGQDIWGKFNPLVRSDGGTGLTYFNSNGSSLPVINDQNWHFVAFIVDRANGQLRAHVDGSSISTAYTNTDALTFSTNTAIGYERFWGDNGNSRWNGYIDDVRIYQRALTSTDIATLYTTVPDSVAPMVAVTVPTAGATLSGTVV